jgi:hypothetical protein
MSGPNAELQAALTQFSTQPGVSADQAAQLRAAIVTNTSLLNRFNQDAHAGHLSGFALQVPGGAANLVGTYDLQTGVMTLPNGSFQASGAVPSVDLKATLKLQDMSLRLGQSSYPDAANVSQPVTKDMLDNLQTSINSSPLLAQQMKDAVLANHLQKFAILDPKVGAGGTYDDRSNTMSLPATSLQPHHALNNPTGFNIHEMTFVLGHEIQHGFNAAEKANAMQVFVTKITQVAQSNNPIHDYTVPIGKIIEAGRKDEAKAELAGWNAVLSNLQVTNPAAGRTEMFNTNNSRMRDFVEIDAAGAVVAKSGITFNPNNDMLPQTPSNIEAMGIHYFDKPAAANSPTLLPQQTTKLGFYREADYANTYGANAISNVINFERALAHPVNGVTPQLHINMTQLRLEERLMERLGISIGTNPNTPQKYYDTSQSPPTVHHFDHTNTTGTPTSHQHVPVTLNTPSNQLEGSNSLEKTESSSILKQSMNSPNKADEVMPAKAAAIMINNDSHPDYKEFQQLRPMVGMAIARAGRKADEEEIDNATAQLLAQKKENTAMKEIHRVEINFAKPSGPEGDKLIALYEPHGRDAIPRFSARAQTDEAMNTPLAQSTKEVDSLNQQHALAQQQELERKQQKEQNSNGPSLQPPGGPAMKGPSIG